MTFSPKTSFFAVFHVQYNNNQEHSNRNNIKVVTCEVKTTEWHFYHICQFIQKNSVSTKKLSVIALDLSGKINYISCQPFENSKKYVKYKYIDGKNYVSEYYEFINECISEKLIVKNCRSCKFYQKLEGKEWEIFCLKKYYNCRDTDAMHCSNFINIVL